MSFMFARCAAFVVAMFFAGAAFAVPLTFNFVYSGAKASPANGSTITGSITFDSTLMSNPGVYGAPLPLALDVTVSGAASGNGHFTLADFNHIAFDTGNGTLNFAQQLVGQAISGGTWGDPSLQTADFNLFGNTNTAPSSPVGKWWFTLCANGGQGDCALLISMVPAAAAAAVPAPTLNPWMLALLGLVLAVAARWTLTRVGSAR